jgi:hypothetical protein
MDEAGGNLELGHALREAQLGTRLAQEAEAHMAADRRAPALAGLDAAILVFSRLVGLEVDAFQISTVEGAMPPSLTTAAKKSFRLHRAAELERLKSQRLPELFVSKAQLYLKLCQHAEVVEACSQATALWPSMRRPPCLAAVALRALDRCEEADAELARFDALNQQRQNVASQRALIARFAEFQQLEYADTHADWPASPPSQPLIQLAASWRARPAQTASTLLALLEVEDIRQELLAVFALRSKRAMACTCDALRTTMYAELHAPTLSLRIEDATYENAAFVARLPQLGKLRMQGEAEPLDLTRLRTLNRVAVGHLSFEAAIFRGAVLGGGEHSVRVSSGHVINLQPLRTRERVNLAGRQLRDQDLACLLGALSLNRCLKELDLLNNHAPEGNPAKVAMLQALPWPWLRKYKSLKPHELLQACTAAE